MIGDMNIDTTESPVNSYFNEESTLRNRIEILEREIDQGRREEKKLRKELRNQTKGISQQFEEPDFLFPSFEIIELS